MRTGLTPSVDGQGFYATFATESTILNGLLTSQLATGMQATQEQEPHCQIVADQGQPLNTVQSRIPPGVGSCPQSGFGLVGAGPLPNRYVRI